MFFFVGRCLSSVLRPDHGNNSNSKKKKKKNVLMHHYDPFNFFIFYFFYKHHIQNNSMKWSSKKMYRAHSAKERKNIVKPCFSISYAKSTNGSFQSITFFMDKKYILKIQPDIHCIVPLPKRIACIGALCKFVVKSVKCIFNSV